MKRKIIIFVTIIFCVLLVIFYFFCPIVVSKVDDIIPVSDKFKSGDTIKPLKDLNVNEIYIVFSRSDFSDIPKGLFKTRVLRTKNNEQIEKFKNLFEFIYSGGDLATCESFICVYYNENLVFKSGFAMTKNQRFGLQNRFYGWAVSYNSSELIKLLKEFNSYHYPFLFIY